MATLDLKWPHFKSKVAAKIQNPPIWAKFGFQVEYDELDVDVVPIKLQQFLFGEKPNFSQIGGLLYFGGHFWFKMATIANQKSTTHVKGDDFTFPIVNVPFIRTIFQLHHHIEGTFLN
jgi:hypothetical protein